MKLLIPCNELQFLDWPSIFVHSPAELMYVTYWLVIPVHRNIPVTTLTICYIQFHQGFEHLYMEEEVGKQDNFESHNSLKLSWGLCSNFVDCKSSLESNSPDILALCQTNLDGSIDSGNFSVRGNLPLIWKDSSTHMHGLVVYVKEGLPFAWELSL